MTTEQQNADTAHLDAISGDARKLAEIRQVFANFDWEFSDRQYALEKIERIVES